MTTLTHPVLLCPDLSSPPLSTVACSVPVSHLGSEDTDAIHPHQFDWQTFTKTSRGSNFPVPPIRCLLLLVACFSRLSVSVSSFPFIVQFLSPPFLVSSPPVLSSEQPDRTSLLKQRPNRKHGESVPMHLDPPSWFPAAFFVLWQLVATFWTRRVHGSEYISARMQNTQHTYTRKHTQKKAANVWRQPQKRTHMDAQANTHTDRRVCTDISAYTNRFTHTHTTLCFFLSGQVSVWQKWGGLSEQ